MPPLRTTTTTTAASVQLLRKDTARQIGQALATNSTLEELDVSFNAFGDLGGQSVGAALHVNPTLRVLNLAQNSIGARGAFTLAAGLRSNTSMVELNMQGNPVGEIGGRALLQVPMDCGDRVHMIIDGCDMKLTDSTLAYDSVTRLPREQVKSTKHENKVPLPPTPRKALTTHHE